MKQGKLYLIPVPLGPSDISQVLPTAVIETSRQLSCFVAENAKSARAFLKQLPSQHVLQEIVIRELNEHTATTELESLLGPLLKGQDVGLISEAGCPAVADPGAALVALAHERNIEVVPFVGPSSILLALMGSGLSGQNFAFHGYLPAKTELRKTRIAELEKDSRRNSRTQIFIETPYRNQQMLESLVGLCAPETRLCVATDLTLDSQQIVTLSIKQWRSNPPTTLDRRPTVFLLQA